MRIGFCGLKGSGKSTAANMLSEEIGNKIISFAGPLKRGTAILYDVEEIDKEKFYNLKKMPSWYTIDVAAGAYGLNSDDVKNILVKRLFGRGLSGRQLLQEVGTECVRDNISRTHWIDLALNKDNVIIDDVRFLNESDAIRSAGGFIIGIRRPGIESDGHASEQELCDNWSEIIDAEVVNDASLEELKKRVLDALGNKR